MLLCIFFTEIVIVSAILSLQKVLHIDLDTEDENESEMEENSDSSSIMSSGATLPIKTTLPMMTLPTTTPGPGTPLSSSSPLAEILGGVFSLVIVLLLVIVVFFCIIILVVRGKKLRKGSKFSVNALSPNGTFFWATSWILKIG